MAEIMQLPHGVTLSPMAPEPGQPMALPQGVILSPMEQQPQSTTLGNIAAPIAGANRIVPQILGAPADLGTAMGNLLGKISQEYTKEMNALTGENKKPLINPVNPDSQIGTSQWLENKASQGSHALGVLSPFEVQNPQSKLQQDLALGGNILGYGLTSGASSIPQAIGNVAKMLPSAAGAIAGHEIAPNNPYATALGTVLGGVTPEALKYAAKGTGKLASSIFGGTAGVGSAPLKEAASAGLKGGEQGKTFLENLKPNASMESVINEAKLGVANMRKQASNLYRSGMVDISKDKSIIPFKPIQDAMKDVENLGSYKGLETHPDLTNIIDQLKTKVTQWQNANPAEFHTPEGLDALKRAIGVIQNKAQPGSLEYKAATQLYNSIKNQIVKEAPVYSDVMRNYSNAQQTLDNIEKTFSIKQNAMPDTALRKLQSLMRNNVNTNYGNRLSLAKQLEEQGNVNLRPALAGQALNSWMPRSLMGAATSAGSAYALATHPEMWPAVAAWGAASSPKLLGLGAYGLGATGRYLPNLSPTLATGIAPIGISPLGNALEQSRKK